MRSERLRQTLRDPFSQQIAALGATGLLAFAFPAGLLLLLLWGPYRRALEAAALRAVAERKTWLALLALGPAIAIAIAHPSPPDDLLRNLHAWRVGYDYRGMYWGSPGIQRGDYYLGFDWAIGWLDRGFLRLGWPDWSWLPVVALDALCWSVALAGVLKRLLRSESALPWLAWAGAILLLWLTPDFTGRVLSGRPESFFALWAFCALAVDGGVGMALWILCGLALSTTYWFFWIYLPAALLMFPSWGWQARAWPRRIGSGLVIFVFGLTFWWIASHGQYVGWFLHLQAALKTRIASVGENERLILGAATPAVLALFAIGMAAGAAPVRLSRDDRYVVTALSAVAAWFALPDMVRYMDSILPLAAAAVVLLADRKWARADLPPRWTASVALLLIGAFIWTAMVLGTGARPLERLRIPNALPGQRVLTWFGRDSYDAVYLNPDLRIAPGFEVGFSRKDVQQASMDLGEGRIDCDWLRRNAVSWVIGPSAPIDATKWAICLRLERVTRDGTAVWRVRKSGVEKHAT